MLLQILTDDKDEGQSGSEPSGTSSQELIGKVTPKALSQLLLADSISKVVKLAVIEIQ